MAGTGQGEQGPSLPSTHRGQRQNCSQHLAGTGSQLHLAPRNMWLMPGAEMGGQVTGLLCQMGDPAQRKRSQSLREPLQTGFGTHSPLTVEEDHKLDRFCHPIPPAERPEAQKRIPPLLFPSPLQEG